MFQTPSAEEALMISPGQGAPGGLKNNFYLQLPSITFNCLHLEEPATGSQMGWQGWPGGSECISAVRLWPNNRVIEWRIGNRTMICDRPGTSAGISETPHGVSSHYHDVKEQNAK